MNLSRIQYLFASKQQPETERIRQVAVLYACCQSAKNRQQERDHLLPLTSELNGFSIDEVINNLPFRYGFPTKPDYRRVYTITEVLKTIKELQHLGYLNDDDDDFVVITLTNHLFVSIAHEWAAASSTKPGLSVLMGITQRQLERMQKGAVAV